MKPFIIGGSVILALSALAISVPSAGAVVVASVQTKAQAFR
jgi:hypothetical protein